MCRRLNGFVGESKALGGRGVKDGLLGVIKEENLRLLLEEDGWRCGVVGCERPEREACRGRLATRASSPLSSSPDRSETTSTPPSSSSSMLLFSGLDRLLAMVVVENRRTHS